MAPFDTKSEQRDNTKTINTQRERETEKETQRERVSIFGPDSKQYLRRGINETITARSKLEALFREG